MYLNKTQICERGWSLKLIEEFLGEPDDKHRLGHYCYEYLYFLPRIEKAEKSEDFKTAQKKYQQLRDAAKLAAKKKAEARIEMAKQMPIHVQRLPEVEVLEDAILHFNSRSRGRRYDDEYYDFQLADRNSDEYFLQRITVNYIRHNLTSYDAKIFHQKGKVGGIDAVPIIRRRVFEEIAIAYPHLADECDRQMISRGLKSERELLPKELKELYEQLELPF